MDAFSPVRKRGIEVDPGFAGRSETTQASRGVVGYAPVNLHAVKKLDFYGAVSGRRPADDFADDEYERIVTRKGGFNNPSTSNAYYEPINKVTNRPVYTPDRRRGVIDYSARKDSA